MADAILSLLSCSRSGKKGMSLFLLRIKMRLKTNEMKKETNKNCVIGIFYLCAIETLTQSNTGAKKRRETGEKSTGGSSPNYLY